MVLALGFGVQPLSAQSGPETADQPLRVVIKPLEPFVIVDGDSYRGFSIDLWREMAARMGRKYELQSVKTVKDQLDTVEQNRADIAITGISITKAREEVVDFSLPYFKAGLQIMTAAGGSSAWASPLQMLQALVSSPDFVRIVTVLAVLIVILGHVFWLLERRRNPDFPKPYLRGVWEGIWYTVVTLVTVGYGDRTAKSVPGRLVAMGWMFLSLFLVASFTANITAQLTVNQIQGAIHGERDLPGKRVATVANSTAAQYLAARRLPYTAVEAIDDAYALLERGAVEAVVYDSPVLLYYANGTGQGKVQIVGDLFQPQDYGVALPTGSPEREHVNQALLEIIEDGTYDQIYQRWFSAGVSSQAPAR
jgi:ABC-type amino acid transport substrate-binding protein